jgi:hypothetical protein
MNMMLIRTQEYRPGGQGIREYDEELRGGGKRLTGLLGLDRTVHREQVTETRVQGIRPSLCLRVVPVFIRSREDGIRAWIRLPYVIVVNFVWPPRISGEHGKYDLTL